VISLSALLRRNIFEPLYCWAGKSPKRRYWRELEQTQYFPEAKLKEIQWQRVKTILAFAWEKNGFYRRRFQKAGVLPKHIKSPDDLRRLPVLTKAEIRANTSQMISSGFQMETLQKSKTGGSTGRALEMFFTEECSELRNACARRHDRWTGWEPGEPFAACWGNPQIPKTVKEKLKQRLLQPVIYLDTMSVNKKTIKDFVLKWRRAKPTLLFGHAHSIFVLAQYLNDLGIEELHPKGIISSSMMLISSERKVIEGVFGVEVIDRYGCEEVSLIGCECEKREGMHLNIEHLFIEFIKEDGTPAASGEQGKLVITDLINKAMPIIRYQVEDVGVPSDKKCSCGRGLPLMEKVTGREADFLIKDDGTKVAGISLIENTLTYFPGLDQMQIVQHSLNDFDIRIVPGVFFRNEVLVNLRDYIEGIFGGDSNIQFTFLNEIQPEQSGKYRFSICNV
jgi:phenylacetate-CoA ligase